VNHLAGSTVRRVGSPDVERRSRWGSLAEFLHDEAVGAVVLLVAAGLAMLWANSAAAASYVSFWHRALTVGAGPLAVTEDLQHWVNDGLMAVFFFVVGLEIKRELREGELRAPGTAVLPAAAAVGGAVLPAVVYLLVAPSGPAAHGWGVPMATDIAFAVGVLALLGRHVSGGAKLFLLTVAIVDDLVAITVIAVFYTPELHALWLLLVAAGVAAILMMRRWVHRPWAYVVPAVVVWYGMLESGVHATLAGVLLGLLTPAGVVGGRHVLRDLEHRLHPLSAFVVVPLFALSNAGVDLRGGVLAHALGQRLTWAVVVALVVGKLVGMSTTTFGLLAAARATRLPADMRTGEIWPVAALGGIGFTVSLFIAGLAFEDEELVTEATVGVFIGSGLAALLGAVVLLAPRLVTALRRQVAAG
jgi:Na+:H+ antiporter, NhaA family